MLTRRSLFRSLAGAFVGSLLARMSLAGASVEPPKMTTLILGSDIGSDGFCVMTVWRRNDDGSRELIDEYRQPWAESGVDLGIWEIGAPS